MSSPKSRTGTPNQRADSDAPVAEVMSDKMTAAAGVADENAIAIPTDVEALNLSDDALLAIATFDDAFALLADSDTPIVDASQVIGNGFAILNDKSTLVGVRMLLLGWRFNRGDKGVFVSAYVVAQLPGMNSPAKFIINDGSTGICRQLAQYSTKTKRAAGLLVPHGLRRSDYEFSNPQTGETSNATTFYLDTSA